jgi:hypothetical protein
VTATVVEWEVPPLVPVTVMVRVPVRAVLPIVIVIVDDPAPVIDVGLNVTWFDLPTPEAESEIAELKPPLTAVLIWTVPELPRAMVMAVGLALIEKPAVVPVTVNVTVVVCTVLPAVPVTVIV